MLIPDVNRITHTLRYPASLGPCHSWESYPCCVTGTVNYSCLSLSSIPLSMSIPQPVHPLSGGFRFGALTERTAVKARVSLSWCTSPCVSPAYIPMTESTKT